MKRLSKVGLVVLAGFAAGTLGPSPVALALEPGSDDVLVRVFDSGSGTCTVTMVPGGHYMVYDTGHWQGSVCADAIREFVIGDTIDLLVFSHPDSDHIGQGDDILAAFDVRQILHTGVERPDTPTWVDTNNAILNEVQAGASVLNLRTAIMPPGTVIPLGGATLTFIAGWHEWPGPGLSAAERRNVVSIVLRLEYHGRSVLFAGDTVGRHIGQDDAVCDHAEAIMVQRAVDVPIKSDVLLAPHHGADNGSSKCFIAAVMPKFVVFSAGHSHHHPTAAAAQRYLNPPASVPTAHMFRTDLGDDEGSEEWAEGRIAGCSDGMRDDDVDILLTGAGTVEVAYRTPPTGC